MTNAVRLIQLVFKGNWHFFADGTSHTRRNLSIRARFNLLLQLLSKAMRLPFTLGVPYCLTVEPASICNLKCSTCPAGVKKEMCKPALLRFEDFKRTIDLFGEYLTYIQLWSWGEPFLNPALPDMISYAKKKGIIIVSSTNGHFLHDESALTRLVYSDLDELILAVDGTTQEVYEQYREGGSLSKVLEGIGNLVRVRNREEYNLPRLHMRMVINPFNEHQKDDFSALAHSMGVDMVSFKKIDTGMGGIAGNEGLLPSNKDFVLNIAGGSYPYKCTAFWNFPVLSSSGIIGLCSLDSERTVDLAQIKDINRVKTVWNSPKARACRRSIKNNPNAFKFCRECVCREPEFKNAYFDIAFLQGDNK